MPSRWPWPRVSRTSARRRRQTVPLDDLPRDFAVVHIPPSPTGCSPTGARPAASAYEVLTAPLLAAGVALSLTLHDLPAGDSPLQVRRRAVYRRVVATALGHRGEQPARAAAARLDHPPGPQCPDDPAAGAGPAAGRRGRADAGSGNGCRGARFRVSRPRLRAGHQRACRRESTWWRWAGRRRGMTRICRTNWLGGPRPSATGCGSADSCPIPSCPPRSTPPTSRLPPTGGWRAPRRSPPGSATAGGRWSRIRPTPESSRRGLPARSPATPRHPGRVARGDRARPG